MSAKKILAVCVLFLCTYANTWAFSLFQWETPTSINKASYVRNIFNIALRDKPWFDWNKTYLVSKWVGWEITWDSVIIDGVTWLPVRYTEDISGWVHSKLVAKEDYYVMGSDTYTVFLRERTSLAWTSQDICTTSTAVQASNLLTNFRPETPVYTYTPSNTTSTGSTETQTTYQQNLLTNFRPETPVYTYTPSNTTSTWVTETQIITQQSMLTNFRPEVPLFKYIVDTAVSTTIDNPVVQAIASMVLTNFRPETPVYTYTPSNTTSTGSTEIQVTTYQSTLTNFRPETPVYTYTPSNTTSTGSTEIQVSTQQSTLTNFRPETPVYTYTPSESYTYSCQAVQ